MSLKQLNVEMLQRPPSTPLTNFIFNVNFFSDGFNPFGKRIDTNSLGFKLDNDNDRSMISIQADLPSFETIIVTQNFLGTQKSFPVMRKHGGETNLVFYAHTNPSENNFVVYNFFKKMQDTANSKINNVYYHKEFIPIFNEIQIDVGDRANGRVIYTYFLKNCIVTKIDQGQLNYEGTDAIKFTMTVHYDDWWVKEYTTEEENSRTSKGGKDTNKKGPGNKASGG